MATPKASNNSAQGNTLGEEATMKIRTLKGSHKPEAVDQSQMYRSSNSTS